MKPFQNLYRQASHMRSAVDSQTPGCHFWRDDDFIERCDNGLPVPPAHMMQYKQTSEIHLRTGKQDAERLHRIMEQHGASGNILEIGCGNGRVLRWMLPYADANEVWGADINASLAMWGALHLHPIQVITMSTYAGLPFCDGHFSFAYAYSVFTHMDEAFTFWLQEVRRLLRPNGLFVLTLHDETAIKAAATRPGAKNIVSGVTDILEENVFGVSVNQKGLINMFLRRGTFERLIERSFEILQVIPSTMGNIQTAYVLRRR